MYVKEGERHVARGNELPKRLPDLTTKLDVTYITHARVFKGAALLIVRSPH